MIIFLQLSLSLWYRFSLCNQTQWVHSLVSIEPVITTKRQKSEVCYLQQVRIAQDLSSTGSPSTQGNKETIENSQLFILEGLCIMYRCWHIPERIYFKIMFHTLHVQNWRIRMTLGQIIWHYEIILNEVV